MKNLLLAFFILFGVSYEALAERRVGVIAGLTGGGAEYARAYQAGIGIAVNGVEADLKFIYEDDQFQPRLSVQAAQKLLNIDHVEALIVGEHASAEAVISAIPATIPLFVWAGESEKFNKPNVFRFYPKEQKELDTVVREIKRRDLKDIALLVSPHDYLLGWARGIRKLIPTRISFYEELSSNSDDLKPIILKLKQRKVSNIGLALQSPLNGRFAEQQRQLGLNYPMFGSAFLQWSSDRLAARGTLSGSWYINLAIQPKFQEAYKSAAGSDDMLVAAAVFHDMAALLRQASTCSDTMLVCLSKIESLDGAVGKTAIRAEGAGKYLDFPFELKTVP